jgi:hypothetical protein
MKIIIITCLEIMTKILNKTLMGFATSIKIVFLKNALFFILIDQMLN